MNLERQNILFRFPKIAVLLLYIPFFVVQGFFNFGDAQHFNSDIQANYKIGASYHKFVKINHGKRATNKLINIRLNKRFQPANVPGCITVSFEVPVYFTVTRVWIDYTNPLLPVSHLLAKTLRGPPAVV